MDLFALAVLAIATVAEPGVASAQTDEIQVYDAEIADHGVYNLMIHTNFTPIGRKTPDFPGGIIPNHSVNGAAEWAYGVTDWFPAGALSAGVESLLGIDPDRFAAADPATGDSVSFEQEALPIKAG